MPDMPMKNSYWTRSVTPLYSVQQYTGTPLAAALALPTDEILPGQVVHIMNNEVILADQAVDGGSFFGLLFSSFTNELDDTDGKSLDPVILRGPGTVYVFNEALDPSVPFALSTTNAVELVAVAGFLKVRGAEAGPTVGTLTSVESDKVEVQLNAPTTP